MSESAPTAPLTVFIADDHKIVRDGLRALMDRAGGYRIVGEAADGRAVVEQVPALAPDLLLTDLAMSELNGIEVTRQLRAEHYPGLIVMLSMHDEPRFVGQAIAAGVNAYVLKEHAFDQLVGALQAARSGRLWLSPQLESLARDGRPVSTALDVLSPREREVLRLFAEGRTTKEIAGLLLLSPKTIEVHRLNLYAKLKVDNVIGLTHLAIREGLVRV